MNIKANKNGTENESEAYFFFFLNEEANIAPASMLITSGSRSCCKMTRVYVKVA